MGLLALPGVQLLSVPTVNSAPWIRKHWVNQVLFSLAENSLTAISRRRSSGSNKASYLDASELSRGSEKELRSVWC